MIRNVRSVLNSESPVAAQRVTVRFLSGGPSENRRGRKNVFFQWDRSKKYSEDFISKIKTRLPHRIHVAFRDKTGIKQWPVGSLTEDSESGEFLSSQGRRQEWCRAQFIDVVSHMMLSEQEKQTFVDRIRKAPGSLFSGIPWEFWLPMPLLDHPKRSEPFREEFGPLFDFLQLQRYKTIRDYILEKYLLKDVSIYNDESRLDDLHAHNLKLAAGRETALSTYVGRVKVDINDKRLAQSTAVYGDELKSVSRSSVPPLLIEKGRDLLLSYEFTGPKKGYNKDTVSALKKIIQDLNISELMDENEFLDEVLSIIPKVVIDVSQFQKNVFSSLSNNFLGLLRQEEKFVRYYRDLVGLFGQATIPPYILETTIPLVRFYLQLCPLSCDGFQISAEPLIQISHDQLNYSFDLFDGKDVAQSVFIVKRPPKTSKDPTSLPRVIRSANGSAESRAERLLESIEQKLTFLNKVWEENRAYSLEHKIALEDINFRDR